MRDNPTDDTLAHVPIEPPTEGDSPESVETELPGTGDDDGGVAPGTEARLRKKVAEERRRRERAELGLPVEEET